MGRTRKTDRRTPEDEQEKLEEVLQLIRTFRWTLGYFLLLLFSNFNALGPRRDGSPRESRTHRHKGFVTHFLSKVPANEPTSVSNFLSVLYSHPDGTPARGTSGPEDNPPMARPQMLSWALTVVKDQVIKEANSLTKSAALHLPADRQDWETIMQFSIDSIRACVISTAPLLYTLAISVSTSSNRSAAPETGSSNSMHTTKSREPELVAIVAILMMLVSRNLQANIFQKIIGVWLFACSASAHIYRVLCRIGLSIGYTSVLHALKELSDRSIETTRRLAAEKCFLVIIDNINRQRKFWRPGLGQHDQMMSGTAATMVELNNCSPDVFDPEPVRKARSERHRLALTPEVLYNRVDQTHLSSVMALHCLNFLVSHCPALSHLSDYVTHEFRTTYALHRMPDNSRTRAHPLSTSNINEGSSGGCRDVLNDILLRQLKLPASVVNSILIIIGGDLGTIEKIRALKTLESSCPHGYPTFSWVLPLVQLWHMGWADLARIINTHWGQPASSDPSSLWYSCGLLARKVKPGVRPDYYPSLALILDTLEADVLDCWRLLLHTDDLNGHFVSLNPPPNGSEIFALAERLVSRWASTHAHDIATYSDEYWEGPKASNASIDHSDSDSDVPLAHKNDKRCHQDPPAHSKSTTRSRKKRKTRVSVAQLEKFLGDHCLANSILRMRDSLWHLEFNWAVADGDIGRAMQVMSVWQFTFIGSGAAKYATELLELASGFLYEFPPTLQDALMDNWLRNLSGLPGCWFPMDLMQEHNIRELKDKAQRHDEDFDGGFFRNVVSRNVRWFTRVRSLVNDSTHLNDRSSTHGATKRHGTANQLRAALERERVHYFVRGRSYGWVAQDDFMEGFDLLPAKLARFLRQTVEGPGNTSRDALNDPLSTLDSHEDHEQGEPEEGGDLDAVDEPGVLPKPSMIVGGRFVTGDVADDALDDAQLHGETIADLLGL